MDELIQRIEDLIQRIKDKLDSLLGVVNDFLGWIPWGLGWLADKVRDAWDYLVGKFNDFWDRLTYITTNMGDRDQLSTSANAWSSQVAGPVSAKKDAVDASAVLRADDTWEGDAADAYAGRAKLHQTALEKVVTTYVTTISTALDTVRGGLTKFYMGLITALGALVVGIISALASSATIFGIPAGIFIAAGAALVAVGAFYTGGELLKSDCTSAKNTLTQKMNDNNGFPDGAWPSGAVL
ncbi:hypothetical protein [Phycicoccus sp.]|uniref:hypothetical protein n=1 Tax=Phycicoccus sp. TaxID=1902410 RepID=UPI002B6C11E0|nr:hypothetical protein [Phycicoccus sp.]HMM93774.1 hypothetical protein [Phycicoccus sp.]